MYRLLTLFLFVITLGFSQIAVPTVIKVVADPSGACGANQPLEHNTTNNDLSGCNNGTWGTIGGGTGSGSPGGTPGQIQYQIDASTFGGFTLSGDCTLVVATGVITCTKINGVTMPLIVGSATTVYVAPANITTCFYAGDGGTGCSPSDAYTYAQAQNKATPWATMAHAASILNNALLQVPAKVQKADTSLGTLVGTINAAVTAMTASASGLLTNGDFFEMTSEILQCTAGCAGTSWTVVRAQSTTTAVAHTNDGITKLAAGFVYQDNAIFTVRTLGATPYSFTEIGQIPTLTNAYPTSYLDLAGNDADPWKVISTSATSPSGGAVGVGGIRVLGANARFHGFSENYVGYQFSGIFESFTGSITCANGNAECFGDHMASLGDASQSARLYYPLDGAHLYIGPVHHLVDSGLVLGECCNTQILSQTPEGFMSWDGMATTLASGSNTKNLTWLFMNEGSQAHIWGPTTVTLQSPGRSTLYGGFSNGSLIDNAANGTFGNSSVAISNAAGLIYVGGGQNFQLYDACGNNGNTCNIIGSIRQRANLSVGSSAFLGPNAFGASETVASSVLPGGWLSNNTFGAVGTLSSVDVKGDRYYRGSPTPCTLQAALAGDGTICYDSTNDWFRAKNGAGGLGYLNINTTVFTSGGLVFASNNFGGTVTGNLSGDISTSNTGVTTLATVNSNVGSCGDSTHVSQVTLDAKGRSTACTPVAIAGAGTPPAGSALFSTTNATTVTATSPTTLIGTVAGTKTAPVNFFGTGTPAHIVARGYYSTPATPASLTIDILIGGTIRLTTGAVVQIASVTNGVWQMDCDISTWTAGVSGTQIANCIFVGTGVTLTPGEAPMLKTTIWSLDTTATQAIDVQATWSTATGSPTITSTTIAMWMPGSPISAATISANVGVKGTGGASLGSACYTDDGTTLTVTCAQTVIAGGASSLLDFRTTQGGQIKYAPIAPWFSSTDGICAAAAGSPACPAGSVIVTAINTDASFATNLTMPANTPAANRAMRISYGFDIGSTGGPSSTFTLRACPTANLTVGNAPSCSAGGATLFTSISATKTAGAGTQSGALVVMIQGDGAGNVFANILSTVTLNGGAGITNPSKVAFTNSSAWTLYWTVKFTVATAGNWFLQSGGVPEWVN